LDTREKVPAEDKAYLLKYLLHVNTIELPIHRSITRSPFLVAEFHSCD